MRARNLLTLAAMALLAGAVPVRAQNSVDLSPAHSAANAGEAVEIALEIDFADPAIGGGLVVDFDPAHLAFASFSFDAAAPDDPSLRLVCPSPAPGCASFPGPGVLVAFAVDTISFPAISGPYTLGRLRFDVLATTASSLSTREDASVAGPIVGVGAFATPTFGGASVVPRGISHVPTLGLGGVIVLAGLMTVAGLGNARRGVRRRSRLPTEGRP